MLSSHAFRSCVTLMIFALFLQHQRQYASTNAQALYRNRRYQQQQLQSTQQQLFANGNNYATQQHRQQQQQQQLQQNYPQSNNFPPPALRGNHNFQQQQYVVGGNNLNYRHQKGANFKNPNESDGVKTKCEIWVPTEVFKKYPLAKQLEENAQKGMILIEICCDGYAPTRWQGATYCRPICENCRNGFCAAPGQCHCYEEFIANDNGDCVFTCPLGCLNGRCYLDGSCQCDPGYKLDETRKFCRPICSGGCGTNEGHNCTEPEVCGCAKGFRLSDHACERISECGAGGHYSMDRNECECEPGYELKNGICQSNCYQDCFNGICYGRNRCICNPGFKYHERSTQCTPI